ncbi:MAG TPA: TatD family hydrolase [Feifaniaceae bacterium]|nr:TatD family hydrolase [Feifaniaceae bacterium]
MRLFDTHAHLLDERFDEDREAIMASLPGKNIAYMLEACTQVPDAENTLAFARKYPFVVAALGTHPHEAAGMEEAHLTRLETLLSDKKAVAVGEIGLDYHYDFSPREVQRKWFSEQLALARSKKLPAVLHVREADGDALSILRAQKDGLTGVMHCFSGSYETAKICLDLGLYIAFGGALTFRNAKKALEIAAKLPMDRLLIETDCPYMTPVPYRGKRNDPSLVKLVCEKLAEIRNMDAEEVAQITLENGFRLFGMT